MSGRIVLTKFKENDACTKLLLTFSDGSMLEVTIRDKRKKLVLIYRLYIIFLSVHRKPQRSGLKIMEFNYNTTILVVLSLHKKGMPSYTLPILWNRVNVNVAMKRLHRYLLVFAH